MTCLSSMASNSLGKCPSLHILIQFTGIFLEIDVRTTEKEGPRPKSLRKKDKGIAETDTERRSDPFVERTSALYTSPSFIKEMAKGPLGESTQR